MYRDAEKQGNKKQRHLKVALRGGECAEAQRRKCICVRNFEGKKAQSLESVDALAHEKTLERECVKVRCG